MRAHAEQDQQHPHRGMEPLREHEASRDSQADNQRVHFFPFIKLVILGGINQIKSRNPEQDRQRQHQWGKIKPSRDSEPRPDR